MLSSREQRGRVIRGAVLTFRDDPATVRLQRAVQFYRRGAVAIAGNGRIVWRGPAVHLPQHCYSLPSDDHGEALVLPGFIDASYVGRPDRPVRIGIATDIGGGTSYSMLHTLGEAYKVAMLQGRTLGFVA